MGRCECDDLRRSLDILRTGKPSVAQLKQIKRGHYAVPDSLRQGNIDYEPTLAHVGHVLGTTPHTLFVTISKRACALLNSLCLDYLYSEEIPIAVLPSDPESNIENFWGSTMMREDPLEMCVFIGMRVMLTKNLNKAIGFVNGMGATVLGMDNDNMVVRTDQGRRISVHPWKSESGMMHYPFRLGYASTLHKVQGATLPHITLWLDVRNMPAAAYVALSRVEYDANWKFLGNPGVEHFTSA